MALPNSIDPIVWVNVPRRFLSKFLELKGIVVENAGSTGEVQASLAACRACGFFALDAAKNPRLSGCLRSL
jgi:hypothetical protein